MQTRLLSLVLAAPLALGLFSSCESTGGEVLTLRQDALATVERVLVLPVLAAPHEVADDPEDLAVVHGELVEQLVSRGYDVVGPELYLELRNELARGAGIDLRPGHAAPVELERLRKDTRAQLVREEAVDAVLEGEIVERVASLAGIHANWDGRSQDILWVQPGESRAWRFESWQGGKRAFSLQVLLGRPGGGLLYEAFGGLHVASRVGSRREVIPVPRSEHLKPARVARAVELALSALPPRPAAGQ